MIRKLTPRQKFGAWVLLLLILFVMALWFSADLRELVFSADPQPHGPHGPYIDR